MKQFSLIFLSSIIWMPSLFASYSTNNLSKEASSSAYRQMKAYVYKYGQDFHPDEAQPTRLKIYSDLGINDVGEERASGAPQWVQVVRGHMNFYSVNISEGAFEGFSKVYNGKRIKVQLLDGDGSVIAGNPTYYHVTDFDGTQYRLHAKAGENYTVGTPILKITQNGKEHLFSESGFEIVLDGQGFIEQFRDTEKIYFISYPDDQTRILDLYRIRQVLPEKQAGRYVLKEGSKPVQQYRLFHPEPDQHRYMVQEKYNNGVLEITTIWTKGEDPFVFKFQTKKPGQEVLTQDDHYFNDENGVRNVIRKKFREDENYQYQKNTFYDRGHGWRTTYLRELEDGKETINQYEFLKNWETEESTQLHVLEKTPDGNWFRKTFDDVGRVTMEWTPIGEVIEAEKPKDPAVAELLELFPEASEESAAKHQKMRWIPESPSDNLEKAKEMGQVVYYSYAPHFAEDQVSEADTRPRTVTRWEQGQFIKREWFAYGSRENGGRYELHEWTDDPEGTFGSGENKRINKEFHPVDHPLAPGKLQSIAHEDGSLEYFYYAKGAFDPQTNLFTEKEDGEHFRIISTRGKLIDGNWAPATKTQTLVQDENEHSLYQGAQILQSDGRWKD